MDFDANSCLVIDSVIYHGNEVTFSHNNKKLLISDLSLISQNLDSIIVYYHGTPEAVVSVHFTLPPVVMDFV